MPRHDLDAIEQFLARPARRNEPTVMDDLRDLWAAIAADPTSHAVTGFAGVLLGLAVTLGPALVWSWWL
jgi:hypothetical protein